MRRISQRLSLEVGEVIQPPMKREPTASLRALRPSRQQSPTRSITRATDTRNRRRDQRENPHSVVAPLEIQIFLGSWSNLLKSVGGPLYVRNICSRVRILASDSCRGRGPRTWPPQISWPTS